MLKQEAQHPLKRFRERAGITQEQLGYAIRDEGTATKNFQPRIHAYEERGKRIPLPIAIRIQKVLASGTLIDPRTAKRVRFKKVKVKVEQLAG